jgi:hypothetical protein
VCVVGQVNNSVFVENYLPIGLWSYGDFVVHQPNRKFFRTQLSQFTDVVHDSVQCPQVSIAELSSGLLPPAFEFVYVCRTLCGSSGRTAMDFPVWMMSGRTVDAQTLTPFFAVKPTILKVR